MDYTKSIAPTHQSIRIDHLAVAVRELGNTMQLPRGPNDEPRMWAVITGRVPPGERIRAWTDAIAKLAAIEKVASFKQLSPSFEGKVEYVTVGDWRLARIAASAHTMELETSPMDKGTAGLIIVMQVKGSCALEMCDRSIEIGSGEMAAVSLDGALRLSSQQYGEQLVLSRSVPRRSDQGQGPEYSRLRHLLGKTTEQNLLRSMVETLLESPRECIDDRGQFLAETISWLLAKSLQQPVVAEENHASSKMSRTRIIRYIEDNLHDPDLSPMRIGQALGCSTRTLHRVFDGGSRSESLNQYLWRRRLERSASELLRAASTNRKPTVTEVAFSFGFSSSAHFSRRFKQFFGETPLRFRQVKCETCN